MLENDGGGKDEEFRGAEDTIGVSQRGEWSGPNWSNIGSDKKYCR